MALSSRFPREARAGLPESAAKQGGRPARPGCSTLGPPHKGRSHYEFQCEQLSWHHALLSSGMFWRLGRALPYALPLSQKALLPEQGWGKMSASHHCLGDKQIHGGKAFPCSFSLSELYFLGSFKTKLHLFQVRLEVSKRKWHFCWNKCQALVQSSPLQLGLWQSPGHLFLHTGHHTDNLNSATCKYFYRLLMTGPLSNLSGICFHKTVTCTSAGAALGG